MDDIDTLKRLLGQTLQEARRKAGLSLEEVSTQVGLVPDVYARIEQGRQLPGVPLLRALCAVLHLSASELLGLDLPASPPPPEPPASEELLHLARLLGALTPEERRSLLELAHIPVHDLEPEPEPEE